MRKILALPLLVLGACNVDNDTKNDQLSVEYNQQRIEGAAKDAGDAAKEVASGVANVATSTGRAIEKEVGDVDVNVNVSRDRSENKQ